MFQLDLSTLSVNRGHCEVAADRFSRRRRQNRSVPGAESLEVRDCPSGAASSLGLAESAHALIATGHTETARSHDVAPMKKTSLRGPTTIYVSPNGKTSATAGKNASRPASLTAALKRAKAGTTIILRGGTYTKAVGMTGKRDITLEAAPGQSVTLAPSGSSGYALKINSSTGITIEDIAIHGLGIGGLAVNLGSSVTLQNISTDGTYGDGVAVAGGSTLSATNSHFDSAQTGDGMDVQQGTVTISNCTFNNNGTAGGSVPGSGFSIEGSSQATITNSQFIGDLNANFVAFGQANVTVTGSTFSQSQAGDGSIFANSGAVTLTGDTFSQNSTVKGFIPGVGFDGIEFYHTFTGTALVSGDTFVDNTADGVYVGGSASPIQILNNTFINNAVGPAVVGIDLESLSFPDTLSAVIQGNTFTVSPGSTDQGIYADGTGVTASTTIGGTGAQENTFNNYSSSTVIVMTNGANPTILGNIGA
jgi:hypothetical protein